MEPQYRIATAEDLPAICDLADELNAIHHAAWPHVFAPAAGSDRDTVNWQRSIGREDAQTHLALERGILLGFITAFVSDQANTLLQPLRFVQIGSVCVRQSVRGKGLGTELMNLVESWAASQNALEVRLNVWEFNSRAVELYKELGYEVRSLSMAKAASKSVA